MAAITSADVLSECTELTSVSPLWLAWVNAKVNVNIFDGEDGITTKLFRIYLAAHFTAVFQLLGAGAVGPVSSATEGGISRAYAITDMNKSALGRTGYGLSALALLQMYSVSVGLSSDIV